MIKDVTRFGHDHTHYEIYCDSCHGTIADCWNWEWLDKPLLYCPILCEDCGTKSSKFMGETLKENEELKKRLEKYEH